MIRLSARGRVCVLPAAQRMYTSPAASTHTQGCWRWLGSAPQVAAPGLPVRQLSFPSFLGGGRGGDPKVTVDNVFDKETPHYRGKLFGIPADDAVFYAKVFGGIIVVYVVFHFFFKGYMLLTNFSLQAVARLGFLGGFISCLILYSVALTCVRRYRINQNAVYNQSIAMVMANEKVQQFLGSHPRTGDFKTYSATGGFKLPLAHRLRSGNYELKDLLALKPRRLRMLFVLKSVDGTREGLVACDVRRETTGLFTSLNVFKSLSITLSDVSGRGGKAKVNETIILIGRPEDIIHHNLII